MLWEEGLRAQHQACDVFEVEILTDQEEPKQDEVWECREFQRSKGDGVLFSSNSCDWCCGKAGSVT